jgi:hypothetical protein
MIGTELTETNETTLMIVVVIVIRGEVTERIAVMIGTAILDEMIEIAKMNDVIVVLNPSVNRRPKLNIIHFHKHRPSLELYLPKSRSPRNRSWIKKMHMESCFLAVICIMEALTKRRIFRKWIWLVFKDLKIN